MSKTIESVIGDIINREGGPTNDPNDRGGATVHGISQVSNPEAFKTGPPTEAQARDIYLRKYVIGPGFDKITDRSLQAQLVDYGVNSGPMIAIKKLQTVLHVTPDGVLGPETLSMLSKCHPEDVSNGLVAERVKMIGQFVSKHPTQLTYLNGWLSRALEFLE